jgi:phage-related protein
MKKLVIGLGAVFISLLMISTVTAVPQAQSQPAMNMIEKIEQKINDTEQLEDTLSFDGDIQPTGLIDLIIQLLTAILGIIQDLILFMLNLFQIVNLIEMIVSAISQLINLVVQFINAIIDLFTPNNQYFFIN